MKKFFAITLVLCLACALAAACACSHGEGESATTYRLDVVYDGDGSLFGSEELEYVNNTGNEIEELKFNLYGNAYRQGSAYPPVGESYKTRAYYGGESYGGIEIENVEGCASWSVDGEDQNILTVSLGAPMYPGERVKIAVTYTLKLADINHRTGITQSGTVNLGNFYPILCAYSAGGFVECPYYSCGDPFVSECADYFVTLSAPEEYVAAASGKLTDQRVEDGKKISRYEMYSSRDFALVLSKDFKVLSCESEGTEISYYYTSDQNPQACLDVAAQSFNYFCGAFGKYIYPTLSVVQTDFCYGGMEYPGLTMIARGLTDGEALYTTVHENAHQWWYAMVGSDQLCCAWQDEGLAEYSTLMFFENAPQYGYTRSGIVESATRSYRAFFTVYKQLNGEADTSMTRNLSSYKSELEYNNVIYNKGLVLFDTLRQAMGDKKFGEALKRYFSQNCKKIASAEDLMAAFIAGGADVEGHFTAFIEGKILI